jgi:hypothetical protein
VFFVETLRVFECNDPWDRSIAKIARIDQVIQLSYGRRVIRLTLRIQIAEKLLDSLEILNHELKA